MTKLLMKPDHIEFYACDWQPNGTNTLLVVDASNGFEVIDSIDQALFGVNVNSSSVVLDTLSNMICGANKRTFDDQIHVAVKEVSVEQIFKNRACSPVDPNGKNVIKFIQPYLTKKI